MGKRINNPPPLNDTPPPIDDSEYLEPDWTYDPE